MQGIRVGADGLSDKVCAVAFENGLIMETSGADGEVIKVMPPLVIEDVGLDKGLAILGRAVASALESRDTRVRNVA